MKIKKEILFLFMVVTFVSLVCVNPLFAKSKSFISMGRHWTRTNTYYGHEDMYAKFSWTVTYLSPTYLNAQFEEATRRLNFSPEEAGVYWNTHIEQSMAAPTFFIALYTKSPKWNTLDAKDESLWRLSLRQGDQVCKPEEMVRLKKLTAEEVYFFPYVEKWDVPYQVRFAEDCRLDSGEPIRLEMDSLYGRSILKW